MKKDTPITTIALIMIKETAVGLIVGGDIPPN
jgi:hypothetical protein